MQGRLKGNIAGMKSTYQTGTKCESNASATAEGRFAEAYQKGVHIKKWRFVS